MLDTRGACLKVRDHMRRSLARCALCNSKMLPRRHGLAVLVISLSAPRADDLQRTTANKADCNEREERYLIVTCIVITDVPEALGPLPVAVMAKASLPLYLAFAVYW